MDYDFDNERELMSRSIEIALTVAITAVVVLFWVTVVVETPVMVFAAVMITLMGGALIWTLWID